jgi:hypothetical protein
MGSTEKAANEAKRQRRQMDVSPVTMHRKQSLICRFAGLRICRFELRP